MDDVVPNVFTTKNSIFLAKTERPTLVDILKIAKVLKTAARESFELKYSAHTNAADSQI